MPLVYIRGWIGRDDLPSESCLTGLVSIVTHFEHRKQVLVIWFILIIQKRNYNIQLTWLRLATRLVIKVFGGTDRHVRARRESPRVCFATRRRNSGHYGGVDAGERGDVPGKRRCQPLVALASLTPRALSCSVPWPSGRPCTRTGSATFLSLNGAATDSMLAIAFPLPPWVTKAT